MKWLTGACSCLLSHLAMIPQIQVIRFLKVCDLHQTVLQETVLMQRLHHVCGNRTSVVENSMVHANSITVVVQKLNHCPVGYGIKQGGRTEAQGVAIGGARVFERLEDKQEGAQDSRRVSEIRRS